MRVEDTSVQILSKLNDLRICTTTGEIDGKVALEDCKTFLSNKPQFLSDLASEINDGYSGGSSSKSWIRRKGQNFRGLR